MGALANAKDNNELGLIEEGQGIPNEPKFFRENWKKLLASSAKDKYKVVRVREKVATITNGTTLLRSPVDAKDGFYTVGSHNQFIPYLSKDWLSFPDTDQIRPDFDSLKPTCQLPREHIGQIIQFCEMIRQRKGNIVMDKDGLAFVQEPKFAYNFPLNCKGELFFNPTNLKLALTEMLRYDFVYMARESTMFEENTSPLIFGHDWTRCALVMPMKVRGDCLYD